VTNRVVVTGGASGIGKATVAALTARNADVAVIDHDADLLEASAQEYSGRPGHLHLRVDVSNAAEVSAALDSIHAQWGSVDAVVHSAGIMREQQTDIREISLESWQTVINVNLTGSFLVAQAAARIMIPQQSGVIILVGSGAGVSGPSGSIPYGASKAGLNGLVMTLSSHIAKHGVRVINFCPGSVDTPLINRSLVEGVARGGSPEVAAAGRARLVSPDGVGRALALLTTPDAASFRGTLFSE